MTIAQALHQGSSLLEDASIPAPRLTAEVLLAHAIHCDRVWLFAHSNEELREVWWIHFGRYLHERLQGKPTQYITGRQEFYGREFRVTPDVLIPRPETEHVIEAALKHSGSRILDIGTGSGAIAITLALELGANVIATDISEPAIQVAAENARRLGANVQWILADLAQPLKDTQFDLIISNPPYLALADQHTLPPEVRNHEPPRALYAGADGLEIYRRIVPEAHRLLQPHGWLVMELGHTSGDAVREMLRGWHDVEIRPDLAGLPRVILARGGLRSSELP